MGYIGRWGSVPSRGRWGGWGAARSRGERPVGGEQLPRPFKAALVIFVALKGRGWSLSFMRIVLEVALHIYFVFEYFFFLYVGPDRFSI